MLAEESKAHDEDPLPGGHGTSCRVCPLGGVSWPHGCPSRERRIVAGRTLIEQGDTPRAVLLLKIGLVGLCTVNESGAELGCTVRGPRTLLGLESLFAMQASYRVWALTELVVCIAPIVRLGPWIGSLDTPLGALMRLGMEEANRQVTERLELGGDAVARTARFLLRRCAEPEHQRLELSQRLVARVLSMTPETISRALSKLHAVGAVISTRPIVIGDLTQLHRLCSE